MRTSPVPQAKPNGRSAEVDALLAAARAVLENPAFADAARAILEACRTILGTDAGVVALYAADATGLEVAVLEAGRLALDPAAGLPRSLRRLSARAATGRSVFANDLSKSKAKALAAGRRAVPENALLAPILVADEVEGLLVLLDKSGGFSAADCRLAEVFAGMAAVALLESRTVDGLESNRDALEKEVRQGARQLHLAEEQFRTLVDNLPDVVVRFAPDLRHLYVSPAIDGLHRLAADLRPASLDHLGLEAALRQCSRSAATGLTVRFKARGLAGERLPAVMETALYRVVQEAMTNVVRHAGATRVDVLAQRRGERVLVMVEDDGVGFEPHQARRGDHLGLLGMRERAEALGGTLKVESSPGAGTTVVVEVPCPSAS